MRLMRFQSGVEDLNWLLRGRSMPYGGVRLTELIYPAPNHYLSACGLGNGHPQSDNGQGGWVCRAELEIALAEIAREVGGFEVASRDELVEVGRKLSVVICGIGHERLEQRVRGVNRLVLPRNELVLRGELIGLLPEHADLAAQAEQFPGRLARL